MKKLTTNEKLALAGVGGLAVLGVILWASSASASTSSAAVQPSQPSNGGGGGTNTGGGTASSGSGLTSSQLTSSTTTGYQSDPLTNQLETTPNASIDNAANSIPTNPSIGS